MKGSRVINHVPWKQGVSQPRAYKVLSQSLSSYKHIRKVLEDGEKLAGRIVNLATQEGGYEYHQITAILRNVDWQREYNKFRPHSS